MSGGLFSGTCEEFVLAFSGVNDLELGAVGTQSMTVSKKNQNQVIPGAGPGAGGKFFKKTDMVPALREWTVRWREYSVDKSVHM